MGLSHRPDAKTTKMAAKRQPVKLTAVSLPVLDYSVVGRAKNNFCLLLTGKIPATRASGAQDISRAPLRVKDGLLDLDFGAGRFDLFLDLFGFCLGHAFLQGLGGAFHQGFRLG